MSIESPDMSAPVTRGELRSELAELETRIDRKFDLWGGALLARMDERIGPLEHRMVAFEQRMDSFDQRMDSFDQRMDGFGQQLVASEQRLSMEMARHANAIFERMATLVSVIDDKYIDLPARVKRLEGTVFKRARKR